MQPQIILYTSSTCAYCEEMRFLLHEQKLNFMERSVEEAAWAKEVRALVGDEVVPVTVVQYGEASPQVVVGYDRQRLLRLLEDV
jgi:glutaredoxin